MHKTKLAARVAAKNRANQIANEIYAPLKAIFDPYVGKKILTQDSSFIHKLRDAVANYLAPLNKPGLQIYRYSPTFSSISFIVKTWETLDGCAYYAETSVYVANLESHNPLILKDFYKKPENSLNQ